MALVQALLVRSLVAMFWERAAARAAGAVGHRRCTSDFLLPHGAARDIGRRRSPTCARSASTSSTPGSTRSLEFRFPRIGGPRPPTSSWSCARPSSPGTSSARRRPPAAPRGTSTPRSSGCRSRVRGFDPDAPPRDVSRCARAPAARRARRASSTPASATARGSPGRRCTPRSRCTRRCGFDVVDWCDRESSAVRRTTSSHPGGRSYEHPPVNANEAEARRASRFEPLGLTAGKLDVAAMQEAGQSGGHRRVPAHARPPAVPGPG